MISRHRECIIVSLPESLTGPPQRFHQRAFSSPRRCPLTHASQRATGNARHPALLRPLVFFFRGAAPAVNFGLLPQRKRSDLLFSALLVPPKRHERALSRIAYRSAVSLRVPCASGVLVAPVNPCRLTRVPSPLTSAPRLRARCPAGCLARQQRAARAIRRRLQSSVRPSSQARRSFCTLSRRARVTFLQRRLR